MKWKKGDVWRPIDRPHDEVKITSKRGADAMNKHQPRFSSDFEKFAQPYRKHRRN